MIKKLIKFFSLETDTKKFNDGYDYALGSYFRGDLDLWELEGESFDSLDPFDRGIIEAVRDMYHLRLPNLDKMQALRISKR
jgi:hypothetical protein